MRGERRETEGGKFKEHRDERTALVQVAIRNKERNDFTCQHAGMKFRALGRKFLIEIKLN